MPKNPETTWTPVFCCSNTVIPEGNETGQISPAFGFVDTSPEMPIEAVTLPIVRTSLISTFTFTSPEMLIGVVIEPMVKGTLLAMSTLPIL